MDLYEELSEFTSGLFQSFREQFDFTEKSAEEIYRDAGRAFGEKKQEILARQKFDNPAAASVFNRKLDEKIGYDLQAVPTFHQQALVEQSRGKLDQYVEKYVAAVAENPDTLTDAIVVIDNAINELSSAFGHNAAVKRSIDARTKVLKSGFESYARQGNYAALQTLLDGIDPRTKAQINIDRYVTPGDKAHFQSLVNKGNLRSGAVRFLEDMAAGGLSPQEQLKQIGEISDQSHREEVLALYGSQHRAKTKAKTRALRGKRYNDWEELLVRGEQASATDIPLDSDLTTRREMERFLAGSQRNSPDALKQNRYVRYEILRFSQEDPAAFREADLSEFFSSLTPEQIIWVRELQETELDPLKGAEFRLDDKFALNAWKKATGKSGRDEDQEQEFSDFRIRYIERVADFEILEQRKATGFEKEAIIREMEENGEVTGDALGKERSGSLSRFAKRDVFEEEHLVVPDNPASYAGLVEEFGGREDILPYVFEGILRDGQDPTIANLRRRLSGMKELFAINAGTLAEAREVLAESGQPVTDVDILEYQREQQGGTRMETLSSSIDAVGSMTAEIGQEDNSESVSKRNQDIANSAVKGYWLGLYGRLPKDWDKDPVAQDWSQKVAEKIQEDYGSDYEPSQGEIYTVIDDLAKEQKIPGLSSIVGYRRPTTALEIELEKYYNETNVFGRFRDGLSYGRNNIGLGFEVWSAFDAVERKVRLDKELPALEQEYESRLSELKKRVKNGSLHPDAFKLQIAVIENPVLVNRMLADKHSRQFTKSLKDASEYQDLLLQGRRNPVLKAMEDVDFGDEFWQLFTMDPMGVVGQFLLESTVEFAATTGVSTAGALVGQPLAGIALEANITGALEYMKVLKEKLLKAGADLRDPESVQRIMLENSEEFKSDAERNGIFAGVTNMLGGTMGELVVATPIIKKAAEGLGDPLAGKILEGVVGGGSAEIVEYPLTDAWEKKKRNQVQ
ncbi:hypothetical protein O4H49_04450 [Kiloniella laminariae]|uniref:Large polyvalent protein associated domain-containing protein n=1 Tax=Kiloniella laminariae TaxID=454162 RepID=A0ABT4LFY7_9PROT|nr:hypothetical protein [Kiloniella laminariae]MCZ4280015.1 hypothetical protein [Kiloniella laminariae]